MATNLLTIKNNKIKDVLAQDGKGGHLRYADGDYVTGDSSKYTENRWEIRIAGDRIFVDTEAAGGFHKSFALKDGVLGLYRGTDGRYAYFRSERFQALLDELEVDSVRRCDPNEQAYHVRSAHHGIATYAVYTDGKYGAKCVYSKKFIAPYANPNNWDDDYEIRISGATWAIVEQNSHRVLYAQDPGKALARAKAWFKKEEEKEFAVRKNIALQKTYNSLEELREKMRDFGLTVPATTVERNNALNIGDCPVYERYGEGLKDSTLVHPTWGNVPVIMEMGLYRALAGKIFGSLEELFQTLESMNKDGRTLYAEWRRRTAIKIQENGNVLWWWTYSDYTPRVIGKIVAA